MKTTKNSFMFYMNPEWMLEPVSSEYENALRSIFIVISGNFDVTYGLSSYTDTTEFYIGAAGGIKVSVDKVQNTLTVDIYRLKTNPGFMEAAKLVLINNLNLAAFQPEDIDTKDKNAKYVVRLSFSNNIEESGTMSFEQALATLEDLNCFKQQENILQTATLTTVNNLKKNISISHPRSKNLTVGYVMIIKLETKTQPEIINNEEPVVAESVAVDINDVAGLLEDALSDINELTESDTQEAEVTPKKATKPKTAAPKRARSSKK